MTAIGILEDAARADPNASGVSIAAAQRLLARARYGVSDSILSDYVKARRYAVISRDSRRGWGGDSVEAILVALMAAALAGDLDGAWKLVTPAPDGEATPIEAKDPRLVGERATLAALMGDESTALGLLDQLESDYERCMVLGRLAERRGDTTEAVTQWFAAWAAATNDLDRIQTAGALAPLGAEMPDLTELEGHHSQVVARIKTLHDVTAAPGDRLQTLRQKAHESRTPDVVS